MKKKLYKGTDMSTQKILLLQPIFCPSEEMTQRNINSIVSLGEYLNKMDRPLVEVQVGGWAKNQSLLNKILPVLKQYFPNNEVAMFKNNVGKAVIINSLARKHLKSHHQFIVSADSDILFPLSTENMFSRMIKLAELMEAYKRKPVGLIAFNQQGQNCHLPHEVYQNIYNVDSMAAGKLYKEKMVWPSGAGGIAGGCLFISRKAWDTINGYRVMGCYSGDDAYFLLDIGARGFSWQMADTIPIIHPPQNDVEYAQWKVKVCQRDSGQNKADISFQIKEAEDFWKDRN
jgi:hypothetical protein